MRYDRTTAAVVLQYLILHPCYVVYVIKVLYYLLGVIVYVCEQHPRVGIRYTAPRFMIQQHHTDSSYSEQRELVYGSCCSLSYTQERRHTVPIATLFCIRYSRSTLSRDGFRLRVSVLLEV